MAGCPRRASAERSCNNVIYASTMIKPAYYMVGVRAWFVSYADRARAAALPVFFP
jgi:hypothetical protein